MSKRTTQSYTPQLTQMRETNRWPKRMNRWKEKRTNSSPKTTKKEKSENKLWVSDAAVTRLQREARMLEDFFIDIERIEPSVKWAAWDINAISETLREELDAHKDNLAEQEWLRKDTREMFTQTERDPVLTTVMESDLASSETLGRVLGITWPETFHKVTHLEVGNLLKATVRDDVAVLVGTNAMEEKYFGVPVHKGNSGYAKRGRG
ncbi:hypothetical protein JTB14_028105 [Gonioctena quinquepunctata]|nr:hypothetical protein JTB14_028105 [Gonioctena quinquepunctata]